MLDKLKVFLKKHRISTRGRFLRRTNFIVETRSNSVSWRFCYLAVVLLMSGLGGMSPHDQAYAQTQPLAGNTPRVRQAVPDAAQLKAVQLKIQEVYGAEIQNASKPADKEVLAAKLLKMAEESRDDSAAYYALLNSVRDLSIGAGNYSQSMTITKKLTEYFELDSIEEHYQVLKKCGETIAATAPGLLEAANTSFQMAEEFAKHGDSEQALRFSRLAHAAATKARSGPLLKQITAFGTEQAARETERKALPEAEAKLAADPADPVANMTLGRWHWFRMDNPTKAMPYLAKTAESPLQKAALTELEKPATPAAQVALADQWWTLAQVIKDDAIKNRILARAGDWYQTAFPEAKGFDKIKAERRLAEIQKLLGAKTIVAATTAPAATLPAMPNPVTPSPATFNPITPSAPLLPVGDLPKTVKTSLGAELIFIPAGKFLMGSPENDPKRKAWENQVPVEITRGFYLGKHEVTQREWRELMGTEPWIDKKLNKPHENVIVGDDIVAVHIMHGVGSDGQIKADSAMAFCKKLSDKEGRTYRLPTEAEWEYACRAGTQTPYCFGSDASELGDYAWCAKNSKFRIQQVGLKKPNAWGLHDMLGNAQEWCMDFYNNEKTQLPGGSDPLETTSTSLQFRIVRGGYFAGMDEALYRSASRGWTNYNVKRNSNGFRLVLEADKAATAPTK